MLLLIGPNALFHWKNREKYFGGCNREAIVPFARKRGQMLWYIWLMIQHLFQLMDKSTDRCHHDSLKLSGTLNHYCHICICQTGAKAVRGKRLIWRWRISTQSLAPCIWRVWQCYWSHHYDWRVRSDLPLSHDGETRVKTPTLQLQQRTCCRNINPPFEKDSKTQPISC